MDLLGVSEPVGSLQWQTYLYEIPTGELSHSNGKSPFLMGTSTISMAIFRCYVSSPVGTQETTGIP